MVFGLLVQLGDEIGPPGGKLSTAARLFRSPRCATGYIEKYNRKAVAAECVSQSAGVFHNRGGRMDGGQRDDTLLQIDDDESGLRVKGS